MVPPIDAETFDDVCRYADRLIAPPIPLDGSAFESGYHNHSFEFHHSFDGDSAYDLFRASARSAASCSSWMCTGPRSRARTWRRSRRCWAGVCARCTSRTAGPDTIRSKERRTDGRRWTNQPLGRGDLDIGAILDATPSCEFDVVEFDHVDGDVVRCGVAIDRVPRAGRGN